MSKRQHALIFSNDATGGDPVLNSVLQRLDISPLLPHELSNEQGAIPVVIIERPVANALKILANLRKQAKFAVVPILVILDPHESGYSSELTGLQADLLFKPVAFPALRRYLESKVKQQPAPPQPARPQPEKKKNKWDDMVFPQPKPVEMTPVAPAAVRTTTDEHTILEIPDEATERTVRATGHKNRDGKNKRDGAPPVPTPSGGQPRREEKPPQKTAPQPKPLDIIPTSTRLMPQATPLPISAKGGVPCGNCLRWKARKEDAYCSRCGNTLISLSIPEEVVTFEPMGEHRVGALIDFHNTGQNPLQLGFSILANSQLGDRFTLNTETALLEGGDAQHLLVTLDARGLDISTRYEAVLQVATNERGYSKRQVQLVVERMPVPRLAAIGKPIYAFAMENQWEFELTNEGGGSLHLTGVSLELAPDSSQGGEVALEILAPAMVNSGRTARVSLKVPTLELTTGIYTKKIRWGFVNLRPLTLDYSFEVTKPPRLAVQPVELDFGVLSAARTRKLPLYLINNGGEELLVESLTPSVGWIECLSKKPFPLCIAPNGRESLEVQLRGSVEIAGDHGGAIKINSNSYQSQLQTIPFVVEVINPEPLEEYIGIDFGTTASCVAVIDEDYQFSLLELDPTGQGDPRIMPSVLYFEPDGTVLAGREALIQAEIQPTNAVKSIKRVLGSKQTKIIAGQEYDPVVVTSKIIEQLLLRTEDGLFQRGEYKTPRQAVVTVPIEFNNAQRGALLKSCALAGLDMPATTPHGVVLDEAHAAALYYLSRQISRTSDERPEKVLIFDFGGGTLDCALVQIENLDGKMTLRTLAPGGDPSLGGEDIDWKIARLLARKAKEKFPDFDQNCIELENEEKFAHFYRDPFLLESAYRTRASFKRQAEAAKIALTKAPDIKLSIEPLFKLGAKPSLDIFDAFVKDDLGSPARFEVTLKYEALEKVLEPFLVRAAAVIETLCTRARVEAGGIDTILHAGRTSLLPMVRERINALLPNATDHSELVEPKLCVALGAAFWGYIKDHPNANFEFIGVANRLVHDIGYLDIEGMTEVYRPVFTAQTQYPCERVMEMRRGGDFINLRLYENRGKKTFVRDNHEISKIGTVRIDTRGLSAPTITVTFRINENQLLEISANDHSQVIELD